MKEESKVNDKTLETSMSGVLLCCQDSARGAATIVEGIRDAQLALKEIFLAKKLPGCSCDQVK